MRFIHIGVGGFGKAWGKCLVEDKRAEVVGLVDVSAEALDAACAAGGHPKEMCFPSLAKALAKVEADAVVISTPPRFHRKDAVAAMKAGLHVITEKPMADSLPDCRAMLKTAVETGRSCVVSQNYRYSPPTWTMADVVRSGKVGVVGQAKVDFFMGVDFRGGFRHTMQYPLIVDMSIHHFDLIRYITGLNAVAARAAAWNPPWSNYAGDCSSTVLFEMSNGARVLYNGSWCSKGQFCDWNGNWQVEGDKGTMAYTRGDVTLHRVPELYRVDGAEAVAPTAPPLLAQKYVLDEFIRTTAAGERAATDVRDNMYSIGMVFAAVQAMRTGKRVAVPAPDVSA